MVLAVASAGSALGSGTVTTLTQGALEAALQGGGAVSFASSGTITLTNTLAITLDTILDANSNSVTISGGNAVRLFQVASNVNFQVKGLTLADGQIIGTNGASGNPASPGQDVMGAGILSIGGNLILNGCTLTNHLLQGGTGGYETNMSSPPAKGGAAIGGAICCLGGQLNLTNCLIIGNTALGGAEGGTSSPFPPAGEGGGKASGGAIYFENASANLEQLTLVSNKASGGPPAYTLNYGTGGSAAAGAIYASNSVVLFERSVLANNTVLGGGTANTPVSGFPSGDGLGGALFVSSGSTAVLRLCSFQTNSSTGGNGGKYFASGAGRGGAIFNAGSLQVWNSTFMGGASVGGSLSGSAASGQGGGICSIALLSVNGSTFLANAAIGGTAVLSLAPPPGTGAGAGEGGAIWSVGSLSLTNSTIAGNRGAGGTTETPQSHPDGAGNGGGVCVTSGTAELVNVTIAANRVDAPNLYSSAPLGPRRGGGLFITNGTVSVLNSIIADNTNGGDVWGTLIDQGHNLCSDSSANFSAAGSLTNTDPHLGPLDDYGGPTLTMPLLAGSPAIDNGGLSGAPTVDQRGHQRPFGGGVDIGAFESSPPYVLSGRVTGFTFVGEASVTNDSTSVVTTNHGFFRFSNIPAGSHTVTASQSDYIFIPTTQSLTLGPDKLDVNFRAFRLGAVSPEGITNGSIYLVFAGSAGSTWVTLQSTNLLDWSPVATNTVGTGGTFECVLPVGGQPYLFYRVRKP